MSGNKYHIIQFVIIMVVLTASLLQGFTGVVKMRPLSPYVDHIEVVKQDLSFKTYLDGSYQDYLAQSARKKTGFREFFSRCYNQVAFTFFGKSANKNIYKGSNHELYLIANLNDITGKLLLERYGSIENAKADAQKNVEETLTLIDTLRQHGTDFLFVFCPTKTAVYPENMPKPFKENISDFCLADYYIQLFKKNDIPHIDFYNYFKSIRGTFPYPLYTRTGSHWAECTIPIVADSILRKIEAISNYRLPTINYIAPNLSSHYSEHDNELENHLDLLFPLRKPKVPQPIFALQDTLGKDKPNLLAIGDGYFVLFEKTCFLDAFKSWNYWKYNDVVISSNSQYNWKKVKFLPEAYQTLEDADIVMAVFTSNYLFDYMCGFTNTAQELFQKGITSDQETIETIIQRIKDNPEWMQAIEQQAKERGISIDENLHKNAEYILLTEKTRE
jgi:hypothetical protein